MSGLKGRSFLGLLGLMSVVVLTVAACGDGAEDPVKRELDTAHAAVNRMIERSEQGQVEAAEEAFNSIHDALHRIDALVRRVDVPQARELSGLVIDVEEELAGQRDASRLAELGRDVLQQIERAAETLGLGPLGED